MSRLLFQGVPGMPDATPTLTASAAADAVRMGQPARQSLVPSPSVPQFVGEADELHEECGVVAIHGHAEAARQAYLALYALQHRGQESAGIATADGLHLANIKGMGLVSEIFTDDVLAKLPGPMAIRAIPRRATRRS
jgi:amidophosphoribosyltransferase